MLNFWKMFKEHLQRLLLLISTTFYPLITIFSFALSFLFLLLLITVIMEVCSERVGKWRFFTIIYGKINMNIVKNICLGNNLPTPIRENGDFPRQKLRQFPSAEANFEGCVCHYLIVGDNWNSSSQEHFFPILSVIHCPYS